MIENGRQAALILFKTGVSFNGDAIEGFDINKDELGSLYQDHPTHPGDCFFNRKVNSGCMAQGARLSSVLTFRAAGRATEPLRTFGAIWPLWICCILLLFFMLLLLLLLLLMSLLWPMFVVTDHITSSCGQ